MHKKMVAVVVPIHSESPSDYELISFQQCFHILSSHPIIVLAPIGMSLTKYRRIIPQFDVITINPRWQSNVTMYNKLKTSRFFYDIFKSYEFILTYELDAFVFKDELAFWCCKNYDYIGAPWFENYIKAEHNAKIIGVGNSGFSLRKVAPIRKILKEIYYKNPLEYEVDSWTLYKAYVKAPIRWLISQFGENYTIQKNFHYHEDVFFSQIAPGYDKKFVVASVEDATRFSFEVNPRQLYQLNGNALPMGCHAWWRYDLSFWKPYIESFGYHV